MTATTATTATTAVTSSTDRGVAAPWADGRSRRNNLDFLRFVFASLVIYSHSYPLLVREHPYAHELFARLSHGLTNGGDIAVNSFFIISGYLISQSWEYGRGFADYARKRFLRIYPGFAVTVLFCALVVPPLALGTLHDLTHPPLRAIAIDLLTLQAIPLAGVFAGNPEALNINGSLWTIRWEIACYVGVAFLGIAGAYRRRWIPVAVSLSVLAVYAGLTMARPLAADDPWLRLVCYFCMGASFYWLRHRIPRTRPLFALSVATLFGGIWIRMLAPAAPAVSTYMLLYVAFTERVPLQSFAKRRDLSYGVYLYAFPVQQLLVQYFAPSLTPITLTLFAFPITCLLAATSWSLVEAPALRLKSRVGSSAKPRAFEQPGAGETANAFPGPPHGRERP